MRYSYTPMVLATALVGQALADPHHGHAHVHQKKDAEKARDLADVDWSSVSYDVDWSTVDYTYSKGQTWGDATSAAAVAASTAVASTTAVPTTLATYAAANAVNAVATSASASTSVASTTSAAASATSTTSSSNNFLGDILSVVDEVLIAALGIVSAGVNALEANDNCWIGTDGPYTNEFINNSDESLLVIIWGSDGSWVNVKQPYVTMTLKAGESQTVSFANGVSGAWSAIYEGIELVDGQVSNTWGEFTFSEEGVVDVSREVNMNGHSMEIVGPECTTNMTTCVFVCDEGTTCTTGYSLLNCENGSQSGANYGTYNGAASGGCGGLGTSASLTTTFS